MELPADRNKDKLVLGKKTPSELSHLLCGPEMVSLVVEKWAAGSSPAGLAWLEACRLR